jgi:hypothetical protein
MSDGLFTGITAPAAPSLIGWQTPTANLELLPDTAAPYEAANVTGTPRATPVPLAAKWPLGFVEPSTFVTDILFRVHITPGAISVSSPVEGSPILFEIWNAFPWVNNLDSIFAEGNDGLELNFATGETWRAWQPKSKGIIVTKAAPPVVSASYLFDFRHDTATLAFQAQRATLIKQHAQVPIVERLEWETDVMRSINGVTQRVSVRRHPRRKLGYDILAASEQKIRELAVILADKLATPIILPLWAEPMRLTADTDGTPSLYADVQFAEVTAPQTGWLERADRTDGELVRIEAIDRNTGRVSLADPIVREFSEGDFLYPCVAAYLADGTGMSRYQTNAATAKIDGLVIDRVPLEGHGATVSTYDGLPLLDRRPAIDGTAAESYTLNHDTFDFGGAVITVSAEDLATITRPRVYEIDDQADLQFWRAFLGQVRGRAREFYTPTFRPNFGIAVPPEPLSAELLLQAEPDTFSFWLDLSNRRDIYIERTDGSGLIRRVTAIADQLDGTVKASLSSPLPADMDTNPAFSVSMLERARLATDNVEITHLTQGARIALTFEAGKNDGADL